jgi:hypothetical protein
MTSCKKDRGQQPTGDYRLHRVEYFDTAGNQIAFKNLSYTNNSLTRIDMISGNYQLLEYDNNKVVKFNNMLLGVPFPITSYQLRYSANNQLQYVTMNSNGVRGQVDGSDSISFTWSGSKLVKITSKAKNSTGELIRDEEINYVYSGDNISKCVLKGGYYLYTAGPVYWKDSIEFVYDSTPNLFRDNDISFFLHEFGAINRHALRIEHNFYMDPYWFDPALLPVVLSQNSVTTLKSNGGRNVQHFKYIPGSGELVNQLKEIKINDRTASRYQYKR